MTSKSEQIMKLIDAGYSKAEIDAIMLDNNVSESTPSGNETVDTSKETVTTNETTTETATTETKSTVNDSISNAVLLTAITNLTKAIQEQNRNSTTSDGNVNATTESVSEILSKTLKK